MPASVYTICGHGTEPIDSITVPDGCMLVVKQSPGCYMAKYDYDKHLKNILCNTDLTASLQDPLANIDAIRKVFGPVMIFKAGDKCPNFEFKLLINYDFPSRFGKISGLIPISSDSASKICHSLINVSNSLKSSSLAPKPYAPANISDPMFKIYTQMGNKNRVRIQPMLNQLISAEDKSRRNAYDTEIKKLQKPDIQIDLSLPAKHILPLFYEHSIHPTKEEVSDLIADEKTTLLDVLYNDEDFEDFITIDIETLFDRYPGIYYHFVCRLSEDPNISDTLFNENIFSNDVNYSDPMKIPDLKYRQVPAVYNTPVLKMPRPLQHYIKQSIYEAERKKQIGKGYRTRRQKRTRIRSRVRKQISRRVRTMK